MDARDAERTTPGQMQTAGSTNQQPRRRAEWANGSLLLCVGGRPEQKR
jgi:hypothetical protein